MGKRYEPPFWFSDALERYAAEVTPKKRGAQSEAARLYAMIRDPIGRKNTFVLDTPDVAEWRDRRLKEVKPGTVRREWALLSDVCETAKVEWKWMTTNPFKLVKKPPKPKHRERLMTADEEKRLAAAATYDQNSLEFDAWIASVFAVETGMRAAEICRLAPADVAGHVARVRESKNGKARDVPLSPTALTLITTSIRPGDGPIFRLTTGQLKQAWRRLCDRAVVVGLTFHDLRHVAATRLSRKVDVLTLARILGHSNVNQLMVYYNEPMEDIAGRL